MTRVLRARLFLDLAAGLLLIVKPIETLVESTNTFQWLKCGPATIFNLCLCT
jgi:hypothetical protein